MKDIRLLSLVLHIIVNTSLLVFVDAYVVICACDISRHPRSTQNYMNATISLAICLCFAVIILITKCVLDCFVKRQKLTTDQKWQNVFHVVSFVAISSALVLLLFIQNVVGMVSLALLLNAVQISYGFQNIKRRQRLYSTFVQQSIAI
ncbi:Hypothetical_protein [Hexamita inflata]|uniref:Hypothetical_protein n=1 Tax=Hexamita inflata TaxID=28002 RepID=A0AA86NDX1_9EUKA|nr:Hypothetical protein HINF_LOCUS5040 [Hexamita inflata]CAI9917400.1 Hypothetical protein HINF_LOCUS5045 [Hexamita inflata]